jgi:competence protein ComEC
VNVAFLDRFAPHLLVGVACLGLAGSLVVRAGGSWVLVLSLAAGITTVAIDDDRRRVAALGIALVLGGLWWGSVRLEALDRSVLAPRIGEVGPALVTVTAPPTRTPFRLRVPARIQRFRGIELREAVLLELPPGRAPPQGAIIETVAELRAPRGPKDGFDERALLGRRGIHVVVRGRSWRIVGRRDGIGGFADDIHRGLADAIAPGLTGERRAVLTGLVLGEEERLGDELRDSFRASGLYHLLAVSGQNIAFVAGGVLLVAWLIGISRLAAEVGALAAICAYVLAVGWQPSVVRAGVAGVLASLAWLASRPSDRWYFLLLGAAMLMAWTPYSLLEPGFQLSFAAVAAIFVAVPRLKRVLEGYPLPDVLAGVVAVSGACGLATAPILLLQFGSVPVYSILSNALVAPVVAPCFGLALLTAALDVVAPPAAVAAAWLNGWLAAYIAACAKLVGALPGAQVGSRLVLGAVALLAVMAFVAARLPAWRRPGLVVLGAVAAVGLAGWQLRTTPAQPPPKGLRLTVLDVGQGDAILLQVREGAVLVDQGPPEAEVDDQLRSLGVRRLALLVLTHPQRDHVGGAAEVIEHVKVDRALDPAIPASSPEEQAALAAARERGVPIVQARVGVVFRLGGLRLQLLWPDGRHPPGVDPNLRATVILATYGEVDALLTADAESPVTLPLRPPRVEILKVAHHGSEDEGLPRLLDLTRPSVAVISCGRDNDYGHPAPTTIAALTGAPGLEVFRTDLDGRVVVETDGERVSAGSQR